jgi:hypothetical protein
MNFGPERFPFIFQGRPIIINKIELFVKVRPEPEFATTHNETTLKLSLEPGTIPSTNSLPLSPWNGLLRATKSKPSEEDLAGEELDNWILAGWLEHSTGRRIHPDAIEDVLLVCHYSL